MSSSLSSQLNVIKQQQIALKVGPHQQQPSILFDKHTARNTSIDTIYSMAILAYGKLQSHLTNSLEQVHLREEILGENMKEINRNTLTKQENIQLSRKLEKFIVQLSPYLLNSECQHILEYLLRNFKVNVFEAETLALALLPYWNYQIYQKVVQNIPKKQHTGKLTFLNQLTSTQKINFSFIVKTLLFSHALMDRFITIVLQGSLLEIKSQKDEVIKMDDDGKVEDQFLKHPLKNFLLKVFLSVIKQKKTPHYKYIIDFASSCLRIRYPSEMTDENFQLLASVMILLSNLIYENGVSDEYILRVTKKLISKFISSNQNRVSPRVLKIVCDFVFLIWQRKTQIIDKQTIEQLNSNQDFLSYLHKSTASKYMIFHHLWNALSIQGVECEKLLESIGVNIKNQEFYKFYESKFLGLLFDCVESSLRNGSIKKEKLEWMGGFIKSNFKYELGVWINDGKQKGKNASKGLIELIFDPIQINKANGLILLDKIHKTSPIKKPQEKISLGIDRSRMQQQPMESQQQEQNVTTNASKKPKKLVELLRSKGVQVEGEIDFSSEDVKTKLIELFETSYSSQSEQVGVGFHQRVLIVEKYGGLIKYTPEMLSTDLKMAQYSIPIKYFSSRSQTQSLESINHEHEFSFLQCLFTYIVDNRQQLQNILFKQLLRLLIQNLLVLAEQKYKQVVVFVAKYYKKLTNSSKSLSEHVQTNQLMLKISQKLFSHMGNSKGKYQNLIHCHCRLLAVLINAVDSHELNETNSPIVTLQMLQSTYTSLVQIFGAKQLYLINMGIIELITRKQLNYQKLKYFIDEVMIKELNYELDSKKQSKLNLNYYQHALSIGRQLVFASYMLGSGEPQWLGSLSPMITSGIAKNQVSIFYGFIKQKLKRNIVRKLFLFFKLTYESKLFTSGFSQYISSVDDYELTRLLHVYSQIYYILLSIDFRDDPKIQEIIEKLMDKITNLFSLDLRLRLFKPLLPNSKLYGYLNDQLEAHKQVDYDELKQLVSICPDEISIQWVGFVKQCLKRNHLITPQSLSSTFTNPHFFNTETNFSSLCQLFCHLSQYDPQCLTPYINQCMNIILAVCQSDSNQDYCLSLLYKVIINLNQMVDPFVGDIYKYVLQCESEFVNKFIQDTVEGLTVPTLIETVKILAKASKHLFNFGVFFKHVCKHGVAHLLVKTLQYYASKIIHSSITDQVDLNNLYELVAEIFLEMTLKFNENQLRKVLIDFVRWSEVKQNQQISIKFNMRKIVIGWIYCKLSSQLKGLFTSFYGYIFDSYLKDLQTIAEGDKNKQKLTDNKRHRTSNTQFANQVTVSYTNRVLYSLGLLFQNDSEKQFMDGTKFDLLSERLSQLFITEGLSYEQYMKMATSLSDCLLRLCNYLTDDYQLKSLNLKILLLLRHKIPHVQQAILTFMDNLIDAIQDRYLLFINDLVPFLIDNIHNRNEKVKAPIKSIINKFEEMSGGKIESYMR